MLVHAQNNFTLLRYLLAIFVVCGHYKTLSVKCMDELCFLYGIYALGDFAVDVFFVISGYLITASVDKQPNIFGFYIRRLFRVYPLYALVIIVQAAIMLWLLPGSMGEHISGALRYFAYNIVFLNFKAYDIDGLLAGLNNPGINPSLWTLKIEIVFYIFIPFMWMLAKRYRLWFLVPLYVASTAYVVLMHHWGYDSLAKQFPAQLRFFAVGIGLYYYREKLVLSKPLAAVIALACFALCTYRFELPLTPIYPVLVGVCMFLVALRIPIVPFKYDISFGVYLFHGPIIQFSLLLGLFQDSVPFLLGLIATVTVMAFIADAFVEQPGINFGRKLEKKLTGRKT